jgi:steroid delta-isomerase-like uncharacterized protein
MTTRQIVESYYQAFNKKDYASMFALVADDVVHEPNQGTPRHGKALFEKFVAHMDVCYREQLTNFVYYESPDQAGYAAVRFVVNGVYLKGEEGLPVAHGQSYVLPAAAFLEVQNGKIKKVSTFYNLEEWIALVSK